MPRVVLPGVLRQHADGASALDVDLPDCLTARHPGLARRIRDEHGELRRFVNVYVDGTDARVGGGLTASVPANAEVLILPSIAGG
jgi:molybdopterin synthase sulfur carrier subunit